MEKISEDIHIQIVKMWRSTKIKMVVLFVWTTGFATYFFVIAENTPQYIIGSLFALMSLLCAFGYGLSVYYLKRHKKKFKEIIQLIKKI